MTRKYTGINHEPILIYGEGPKSLYLATPLRFNPPPPLEGFSWDDLRKIFIERSQMGKVPNGVKHCRKFQSPELGARTLQTTDDRQTTDGRAIAYSEREREEIYSTCSLCLIKFASKTRQ